MVGDVYFSDLKRQTDLAQSCRRF